MKCRERETAIVDAARGVAGVETAAALRHADSCSACAQRLERERALTAALRALDAATSGDAPSPCVEAALLAAFAARGSEGSFPRAGLVPRRAWHWMAAAAAVVLVALGAMTLLPWPAPPGRGGGAPAAARSRNASIELSVPGSPGQGAALAPRMVPPAPRPFPRAMPPSAATSRPSPRAALPGAFVPWPGAAALPAFENGELVRTELPVSVLPLLGLGDAGPRARERVAVDVVVGQDGLARAVRLAEE